MNSSAFLVSDVGTKGRDFLDYVSNLLRAETETLTVPSLTAEDLRILTEEEAINEAIEDSAGPRGSSGSAQQASISEKSPDELLRIATDVRKKREDDRRNASQFLKLLQCEPTELQSASITASRARGIASNKSNLRLSPEAMDEAHRPQLSVDETVDESELILHISVYLPMDSARVSEEWLVLGSQFLTELKDKIFCLNEKNIHSLEEAENETRQSDAPRLVLSKPSSYFYIEGTFFVDKRNANAIDYSEVIRLYLGNHKKKAPLHPPCSSGLSEAPQTSEYEVCSMEDTKFQDLWIRLGAHALYCHQGGCEHILVFNNVRLFDSGSDPQDRAAYPAHLPTSKPLIPHRRSCEACKVRIAKKVTYNDNHTPHSPFFWCEECFRLLHYDANGQLIYKGFLVFPYQGEYNV